MNFFLDLAPLPYEIEALEKSSGAAVIIIVAAVTVLAAVLVFSGIRKNRK